MREQTAEASNRMIDAVLATLPAPQPEDQLHLWSDCGPHFRSYENMAHHRTLCTQRSQTVVCSFLAEQHGKNILDAAFGTVGRFIQEAAMKRPIYTIQNLLGAITAGARAAKRHDPQGPKWNVQLVDFGEHRALQQQWVQPSDFKVTRTYCWTWKLPYGKLPNCRLYNHVFPDNRDDTLMSYEVRFFDHPGAIPWKKAYLEGEHSWQQGPPDIGEETVLVRRQKDQRQHPAPPGLQPVRTFEERVASQARKAIRDRSRLKRQLEALAGPTVAPVSSSSSGSSSSSSSDTD